MQHREASPLRAQDQIMEVQGEKEHKQMLKLLKQEPDTWLKTPLDWPQGCG
jgi:folylpolyglutamate synthase/dihydropteroate synthase